ncbi:MAG: class I adenylate-forming enzyme family protein [Deltaproteobacteria bacterium]
MAVCCLLERSALRSPGRVCVTHGDRSYTYREVNELSDRFAVVLQQLGCRKGDRILIAMDNCPAYIVAFFAVLKLGAVVVPLPVRLAGPEVRALVMRCTPLMAVVNPGCAASFLEGILTVELELDRIPVQTLKRSSCPRGDETAALFFTSGTSSAPKGVLLTHRNLEANAESICSYLNLTASDSVMAVLPFGYAYGNSVLTSHIRSCSRLVIEESFLYPAYTLRRIDEEKVTGFSGVPSHYLMMRSCIGGHKLRSLRYFTLAGGGLPREIIEEYVVSFPHARFFVMYGQTEATARLSCLAPHLVLKKRGCIGKAVPGVSLQVLNRDGEPVKPGEVGEITARGPNIMAGYLDDPEGTGEVLRNHRLFTGDLATVDAEGFIYFIGRKKEIIKSGAFRISPEEIEETVMMIPGVEECAAVAVPDRLLNEAVMVFVASSDPSLTEESVVRFCRERLSPYKVPRSVEFTSCFPRTVTGKIQRSKLSPKGNP